MEYFEINKEIWRSDKAWPAFVAQILTAKAWRVARYSRAKSSSPTDSPKPEIYRKDEFIQIPRTGKEYKRAYHAPQIGVCKRRSISMKVWVNMQVRCKQGYRWQPPLFSHLTEDPVQCILWPPVLERCVNRYNLQSSKYLPIQLGLGYNRWVGGMRR